MNVSAAAEHSAETNEWSITTVYVRETEFLDTTSKVYACQVSFLAIPALKHRLVVWILQNESKGTTFTKFSRSHYVGLDFVVSSILNAITSIINSIATTRRPGFYFPNFKKTLSTL